MDRSEKTRGTRMGGEKGEAVGSIGIKRLAAFSRRRWQVAVRPGGAAVSDVLGPLVYGGGRQGLAGQLSSSRDALPAVRSRPAGSRYNA
eukprot:2029348-Pyramimonas_sp.AAC.1